MFGARKHAAGRETGFTLIELLVVMTIAGILAAIAIPAFLSEQDRAKEASVQSDVTVIGKDLASYYVDGMADVTVSGGPGGQFDITDSANGVVDSGPLSAGNRVAPNSRGTVTGAGTFCVAVVNTDTNATWRYESAVGLSKGTCS